MALLFHASLVLHPGGAAAAGSTTVRRSVEGSRSCGSGGGGGGLRSKFVQGTAAGRRGFGHAGQLCPRGGGGSRVVAWFKFGNNGMDSKGAGIYGSQGREDFDRDDVEQVVLLLLFLLLPLLVLLHLLVLPYNCFLWLWISLGIVEQKLFSWFGEHFVAF
jgi:hypothetical protein